MVMSKRISLDVLAYLQKEGHSVEEIASFMDTTVKNIKNIANPYKKATLDIKNINSYLETANLKFWELAIKAIPLHHLSKKARTRVLFCKEVSDRIKRKHRR